MKYRFFLILSGLLVAVALMSAGYNEYQTSTTTYRYTFTSDTITNTEADTLNLPVNVLSNYQYNYTIKRQALSGTTNVDMKIQESAVTSGSTDWLDLDATSAANDTVTTTAVRLVGTQVYGVRQRVILTGTGTQSTRYTVTAVLKKKQ